jgi:hypothetical protein
VARVIFEGLSMKQAETLASWYEGQGEQSAEVWFDINDVPVPYVDIRGKGIEVDKKKEEVTVYCK